MNPQWLFGVQFTLSLIIFAMIAKWYISPALNRLPLQAALVPLFLVHALRYLPSSAFAPGQVDPKIPMVTYGMGGNWYIINYYVPVIGVIHVMIFARLLRGR